MINKAILVGNLGTEPETRNTNDNKKVVSFSLATSESWKDQNGERQTKTEWHKVVIFNQGLCSLARHLKKGSKVYIEGQIKTRKWADNQGVEKYTTEIVLPVFGYTMSILDTKEQAKPIQPSEPSIDDIDDDIIF